ncbi:MAG: O-antigen ligase family protein [Hyphomonadaceae bacterium]|nr:O-antigen ligase family protein [Hyphomonadaceae bacterium]
MTYAADLVEREPGFVPRFNFDILVLAALIGGPTLMATIFGAQSMQYFGVLVLALPFAVFRIVQPYPNIKGSVLALIAFALLPMLLAGLQAGNVRYGFEPPNFLFAGAISATIIAGLFGAHLSDRDFRSGMHLIALIHCGYCIFGLAQPAELSQEGARFSAGGIGVQIWGELGVATVAAAVLSGKKHIIVIAALLALPVVVMTQARGPTMAALLVLIIYINSLVPLRFSIWIWLLLMPAFVVIQQFGSEILDTLSALLLLDDPYRGVSSGFSGRFENWQTGWEAFARSPLIGSSIGDPVVRYTHNGFIMAFAELGIVGGGLFLVGMLAAVAIALVKGKWDILAALAGYFFFIMSTPRYLNFSSVIVIGVICALRMLAPDARRDPSSELQRGPRARAYSQQAHARQRFR